MKKIESSLGELKPIARRYVRKPRKCPVCGSNRIADIIYGLIGFSPELREKLDSGKVVLGGCCLGEDDPDWQCADCNTVFYPKK